MAAAMLNAFGGDGGELSQGDRALLGRRAVSMGSAYRLFYERPVHFVRGEGVWLFDPEGRPYLDAYNNVACVGHCHPRVVAAVARQAAVLNTHTRYLTEGVVAYAERLTSLFPAGLDNVMFACTGSEANDLAIRIAKTFTGRRGFVVTELAYHGGTEAVAAMSPSLGRAVPVGQHVRLAPAPDSHNIPRDEMASTFARGVRAAIADLERHGVPPAALLVDTIFASDGIFADPAGFLGEAVEAIHEAGGLFIADEVQAGFGRTGDRMWGFERHEVSPDLVTLGKPMGAGYPLSGVVARPEVIEAFGSRSRYFNTFGGSPVACAAGQAVLDVIEDDGLLANAQRVGTLFREALGHLFRRHEIIADVRGAGLFIGVEVAAAGAAPRSAVLAAAIVNGMRERGVLISSTGPRGDVLKIRPPLVFSEPDVAYFIERLQSVLEGLA